ncbi:hypothetical protein [Candidatus Cardinium hertigii]|uniref:Uncharacterized protein n=1 Tax=Candidatus Cardinium hertigii TaxID=247481 RepID=A0A2Z3LAE4_9BACT|nr:hypothetical protein [Candidatus Cardinium hertigii]AWN82299.1 hypothetical protein DK880_01002 [Candidatus Cardinium hertigii]
MKEIESATMHKQGMAVSIGVHLFFMGMLCCIQQPIFFPSNSNGLPYTIALEADQPSHSITKKTTSKTKPKVTIPSTLSSPSPYAKKIKKLPKQNKNTIDARGLYHTGKHNKKPSRAILELPGWQWDRVPIPKDPTEECGKIVFEIKVDANGEVVAVRTIEKTITPLVEKIYADELRSLTFSKTNHNNASYRNLSTGKVIFILVAK